MARPDEFDPFDPRNPARPISPSNSRIPTDPDPAENTGRLPRSEWDDLAKRDLERHAADKTHPRVDEDEPTDEMQPLRRQRRPNMEADTEIVNKPEKVDANRNLRIILGIAIALLVLVGIVAALAVK